MNQQVRSLTDLASQAIPGERSICKCCGGLAQLFGRVDFQKNCEEHKGLVLPNSGIVVTYFRCNGCGFLFTRFFDHWTSEEFQVHIYNAAYAQVDPDYAGERSEGWANNIAASFQPFLAGISALDWGGGSGHFAATLRAKGALRAETWDPFNQSFSELHEGDFNLVSCIEVLEHLPDPKTGIRDLTHHLRHEGAILVSTLLQPENITEIGTSWWYLAPRNGHISLYTVKSLELLFANQGCLFATTLPHVHWAWRQLPDFLKENV